MKISGGGRCNVTNGHCADNLVRTIMYYHSISGKVYKWKLWVKFYNEIAHTLWEHIVLKV